jgi:hypothetical protein
MAMGLKSGGRKKGVPNRRTLELADQLQALGYDLVSEVLKNLARIDDPHKAAQIQVRLMNFVYPTRGPSGGPADKAPVDVTPESTEELSVEELQAIALAPIKPV